MTTLHLVSCPLPLGSETAAQLDAALSPEDSVLFMGNGIYAAATLTLPVSVYVLEADIRATGLQPMASIRVIDYDGMARLCEQHERSVAWS